MISKKNPEGYLDMTAYKAISNVEKEKNRMVKIGDIVSIPSTNGSDNVILIVNTFDNHSLYLKLFDNEPSENALNIVATDARHYWVELSKICFVYNDRITPTSYGNVASQMMQKVLDEIQYVVFGSKLDPEIPFCDFDDDAKDSMLSDALEAKEKLSDKVNELIDQIADIRIDLLKAESRCEVFEELYYDERNRHGQ